MTRRPIVSLLPLLYINRGNSAPVCHCSHHDPHLTTVYRFIMGSKLTFVGDEVCSRRARWTQPQAIQTREYTQWPGLWGGTVQVIGHSRAAFINLDGNIFLCSLDSSGSRRCVNARSHLDICFNYDHCQHPSPAPSALMDIESKSSFSLPLLPRITNIPLPA